MGREAGYGLDLKSFIKENIMSKRIISIIGLLALTALMTGMLTAAAPLPTIVVVDGLPLTMHVGDTHTVVVQVESTEQFISATALPSFQFPGKGVVAVQGGDRVGSGMSATLEVTFKAKSPTADFPTGGAAPVHVVVGVRYGGGYVVVKDFEFPVTVLP
jgi:hypothetical protein